MPASLPQPLPSGGLTREAVALIEVGQTTISRSARLLLVAAFLIAIVAVPIGEWTGARISIVEAVRAAAQPAPTPPEASLWQRILARNRVVLSAMSGFERRLEDEAAIGRMLRPPVQAFMTGWLHAGNERVYVGREDWLFYRPDVEYVTGPGFLESGRMEKRIESAAEWTAPPSPDPRPAILAFHQDLQGRGITLVLMPTPVKPGVHPERLARGGANVPAPLQNASYAAFIDDLRRSGVLVFDPAEALAAARQTGPAYLATDTHWRPEAMEMVAELAATFLRTHGNLLPVDDPGHRIERVEVSQSGDTARMLDLPPDRRLFAPETVWVRRVLQSDGSPWRSTRESDILVLGDSYTNIYSLESMAWGTSAGFAEHLSYALRRPVDRIVQNDDASFATRAMLQRDSGRLAGKRVVLYQFAVRELAQGDWQVLRLQ